MVSVTLSPGLFALQSQMDAGGFILSVLAACPGTWAFDPTWEEHGILPFPLWMYQAA